MQTLIFPFKVKKLKDKIVVEVFDCILGQSIKLYTEYDDEFSISHELRTKVYYKHLNILFKRQ